MKITIVDILMAIALLAIAPISFYMGWTEHKRQIDAIKAHTDAPVATEGYTKLMNVSAYCVCEKCCGKFADGITASGKPAVGRICAAPPEYPFGTKFVVDGVVWTCEDRGGAIKGNKLDLLFPSHQEALNFGRQYILVKVIK